MYDSWGGDAEWKVWGEEGRIDLPEKVRSEGNSGLRGVLEESAGQPGERGTGEEMNRWKARSKEEP